MPLQHRFTFATANQQPHASASTAPNDLTPQTMDPPAFLLPPPHHPHAHQPPYLHPPFPSGPPTAQNRPHLPPNTLLTHLDQAVLLIQHLTAYLNLAQNALNSYIAAEALLFSMQQLAPLREESMPVYITDYLSRMVAAARSFRAEEGSLRVTLGQLEGHGVHGQLYHNYKRYHELIEAARETIKTMELMPRYEEEEPQMRWQDHVPQSDVVQVLRERAAKLHGLKYGVMEGGLGLKGWKLVTDEVSSFFWRGVLWLGVCFGVSFFESEDVRHE